MKKTAFLLGAAFCAAVPSLLDGEVVSFKDAAKIKSWDAWGDNAPPSASNAVAKVRKVLRFLWFTDERPSSLLEFDRVTVSFPGKKVVDPVWVDMITGRVFEIPAESVKYENDATVLSNIPMWDSPVMITDRLSVPLR